jgi:hypothetical protein
MQPSIKSCPDTRQGLKLPQIHARTKRPEIFVLILCSTLRQERGYGLSARNILIGGDSTGKIRELTLEANLPPHAGAEPSSR